MRPAAEKPAHAVWLAISAGEVLPRAVEAGGVEAAIKGTAGAENGGAAGAWVDENHEMHDRLPFLISHGAPGDGFGQAGPYAGRGGAEVFPGGLHGGAPDGGRMIGILSGNGKEILPFLGAGERMAREKVEGLCPSSTPAGNSVSCTFD